MTVMWESERENAERLTRKVELLSGAMIGLLGLGFFSINWMYEDPSKSMMIFPKWTVVPLHGILFGVVLIFARALAILYVSKPSARTATEFLEITSDDIGKPTRRILIIKLSRAYNHLKLRNEVTRTALRSAQTWFASGLALLLFVLLVYLVFSVPHKVWP